MDRKRIVDIFQKHAFFFKKQKNKQRKIIPAELEKIDQNSAFCEDETHTENAMFVNIAQFLEIKDKQRVV